MRGLDARTISARILLVAVNVPGELSKPSVHAVDYNIPPGEDETSEQQKELRQPRSSEEIETQAYDPKKQPGSSDEAVAGFSVRESGSSPYFPSLGARMRMLISVWFGGCL